MKSSMLNKYLCLMSVFVFCSLPLFAGGGKPLIRAGRNLLRPAAGKSYPVSYVRTRVPYAPYKLTHTPVVTGMVERQVAASELPSVLMVQPDEAAIQTQRDLHIPMAQTQQIGGAGSVPTASVGRKYVVGQGLTEIYWVFREGIGWRIKGSADMRGAVEQNVAQTGLSPQEQLIQAATNGDLAALKTLFANGVKPSNMDDAEALFNHALRYPEVLEYLLAVDDPVIQEVVMAKLGIFVQLAIIGGDKESVSVLMNRYVTFCSESDKKMLLETALDSKRFAIANMLVDRF